MRILTVINLKGGVGKTISAINIAYTLTTRGARVLLIDNDKQGNASKFFGVHNYTRPTIANLLTDKNLAAADVIRPTQFPNLWVIPANMNLIRADREVLLDASRAQQTRLLKALTPLEGDYDFAIIDNAPDLGMSAINALVASSDVLIPIKIDKFSLDGLAQIVEQVQDIREFNPRLHIVGGFVTMFQKNNVNISGLEYLQTHSPIQILNTTIAKTVKVDESTFAGLPLLLYAKKTQAAADYVALTEEYLDRGDFRPRDSVPPPATF